MLLIKHVLINRRLILLEHYSIYFSNKVRFIYSAECNTGTTSHKPFGPTRIDPSRSSKANRDKSQFVQFDGECGVADGHYVGFFEFLPSAVLLQDLEEIVYFVAEGPQGQHRNRRPKLQALWEKVRPKKDGTSRVRGG